jgi:hypothetical protein
LSPDWLIFNTITLDMNKVIDPKSVAFCNRLPPTSMLFVSS